MRGPWRLRVESIVDTMLRSEIAVRHEADRSLSGILTDVGLTFPLPEHLSKQHMIDAMEDGLVRASRDGDRSAFGRLYTRYNRMVHAIVLARVPPGEADDLVQDVFVTALRKLHDLRDEHAFGGWLAAIARNSANGWHRGVVEVVEMPELAMQSTQEEEHESRRALAAIRTLSEAYRETLLMRLVEGMTGPEIAARTGLTPDSVRVNLHRGMRLLREALEKGSG